MPGRDAIAIRARGPVLLRRRAYRSLAYALAATPCPAVAIFESTGVDPLPRILIAPRQVVATLRADPFGTSGAFDELPILAAPEPPAAWPERRFAILPIDGPGRWTWARPTGVTEAGSRETVPAPDLWLGIQTLWVRRPTGEIAVARRLRLASAARDRLDRIAGSVVACAAARWADATSIPSTVRALGLGARAGWCGGDARGLPREAWLGRRPEEAARTAEALPWGPPSGPAAREHAIVFGASGAGKTTYLADLACQTVVAGGRVVVIDLHGDLAPAIVARLPPPLRAQIVAVDAVDGPVPGIAALAASGADSERAAAHLVAALKRLTPDGTDLYWGFRLERIFDTFVRLVQESDGSLLDLYGLLTDPRRRDAARWSTRREDLASFLEELGPVLKRNPEFLWSAATRLSKIVLVPALGDLLAPEGGGLDVEGLLAGGRSLLVRLPIAGLGPEAASFAAALVLGRIYLGLVARHPGSGAPPPVHLVLDEVHGFPPRLIAEILTEGRKFGVHATLATQYPERLAVETRSAAAGALTSCVAFRVPRATSRDVGAWLGLSPAESLEILPELPAGRALSVDVEGGGVVALSPVPPTPEASGGTWSREVDRTRGEFPRPVDVVGAPVDEPAVTERLLLAVLGAEESGRALFPSEVVASAAVLPGRTVDVARLADRWRTAVRRGWVSISDAGCRITSAGEAMLGLGNPTGATRESAEHRALLVRTFRIFARHGARLEILHQGRYDTTLPDARYLQLPSQAPGATPRDLAVAIDRARPSWAWRYFGGRDVEVEAEVSSALRAERIRRDWRKAEARGAYALFVVGDARRARRVQGALRALGVGPDRARVWTLPTGLSAGPGPTPPTNG
jgi:hypothetical protein